MPIIANSTYKKTPRLQFTGNLQTLIPGIFRKVEAVNYQRERLELPDGDFLDLDWLPQQNRRLVILTHGLEGNTSRHYIKGAAKLFAQHQWDVLAWNCRSCSGEMNRLLRMYHHGEIEDIDLVIQHALQKYDYDEIALVGYSMGGSITLKYLGVHGDKLHQKIKKAAVFSVPCDLIESIRILEAPKNWIYRNRFKRMLSAKMKIKAEQFPDIIDFTKIKQVKKWEDFDSIFSAPVNGFNSTQEFYHQASSINYLQGIRIPILLVNAKNDPILTPLCSPTKIAKQHDFLFLETPEIGGHVGFCIPGDEFAWSEYRALEFIENS